MAYVSDSNLTQFWGLAKDYINAEDGRFANWQKTEKSGAVTCWPVPETDLEPVVEFLFTETLPEGTKGPSNPSTISGVSEVKVVRKGKNLSVVRSSKTYNGVTFTSNGDGTYTVNGTASGGTAQLDLITKSNKVPAMTGKPVIPSGCPAGGDLQTYSTYVSAHDINGTWRQSVYDDGGNGTTPLVPNQDGVFVYSILIKSGTTVSNLLFKPQLEYGDVATAFEEPEGTTYIIPLGNTYYGGTLDVASGVMTVTHSLQELTTNSPYAVGSHDGVTTFEYKFSQQNETTPAANATCSHFNYTAGWSSGVDGWHLSKTRVYFDSTTITSGTDFSDWVTQQKNAGTPVVFTFMLENPFTIQLTPTQIYSLSQPDHYTPRINTVYSDQQSVQVGYAKSPIRSEYELTQAIIATEGGE